MSKCFVAALSFCLLFSMPAPAANSPASTHHSPVHNKKLLNNPTLPFPILVKKKKLNFIDRFIFRIVEKKARKMMKKGEPIDPDKLARQAHLFGWISIAALFIFPIASIAFGVLAITHGTMALQNGTKLEKKARTGRTTGIIALALFAIALALVLVIIAGLSI